jgi:hydroxyacylglutathione hydrolase
MQVTSRIHAIKIAFTVPVSLETVVERFAFVYFVFGDRVHLIDSGVAGAETIIFDYIQQQGRAPEDIATLIITHAHPDHIGSARNLKKESGCTVVAHALEQNWIEDTDLQFANRPVPGFHTLVAGPLGVDKLVAGGEMLELEKGLTCKIIHTSGHSPGSISLHFAEDKSLFTADALISPGDLPIYDNIADSLASIKALQEITDVETLFSSWEPPLQGREKIRGRMEESLDYLNRIHAAVVNSSAGEKPQDIMELCQEVVKTLGLPAFAVNPLVATAFASSLAAEQNKNLTSKLR